MTNSWEFICWTLVADIPKEAQNDLRKSLLPWAPHLCQLLHRHWGFSHSDLGFQGLPVACFGKHGDPPHTERSQWKSASNWDSSASQWSQANLVGTHCFKICPRKTRIPTGTIWAKPPLGVGVGRQTLQEETLEYQDISWQKLSVNAEQPPEVSAREASSPGTCGPKKKKGGYPLDSVPAVPITN